MKRLMFAFGKDVPPSTNLSDVCIPLGICRTAPLPERKGRTGAETSGINANQQFIERTSYISTFKGPSDSFPFSFLPSYITSLSTSRSSPHLHLSPSHCPIPPPTSLPPPPHLLFFPFLPPFPPPARRPKPSHPPS